MQVAEVDAFAKIMLQSYVAAASEARRFTDEYHWPPTRMDTAHRFRSIVQALVSHDQRYALHAEFMESGRVQITDQETRRSFLIRSKAALDIEDALRPRPQQLVMFEELRPARREFPDLLAYFFDRNGMRLWTCPTKQMSDESRRLVPSGRLGHIGHWRFDSISPPNPPGGGSRDTAFDQGPVDPWLDLGNPDIDGEAGER